LKHFCTLNEHQAQVLYSICTSTHGSYPYILHGPPGTGKTRLIAKTVICLIRMSPKSRILLTAPSNRAADMIALKVMEEFDGVALRQENLLRFCSASYDYSALDERLRPIVA
jgi:helicase MOV-10